MRISDFMKMSAAAAALCASPAGVSRAAVVAVDDPGTGWVMTVDGAPFFIQGISYQPEKVGEDPNAGTLRNWMAVDDNRNGLIDTAYESFVDANANNARDAGEPTVGDWSLLREMGVNAVRLYHHPSNDPSVQAGYLNDATRRQYNFAPDKAALRDLHASHGIYVAMGDFFGAYSIGSGASPTDYTNAAQRARILASVQQMVADFKDEPFLLMYVLGNENNLEAFTATNANTEADDFASLVGEAVALIKAQDPNHPVAISLGDDGDNVFAQLSALPAAQQPDIIGTNVYDNVGTIHGTLSSWDKPVVFLEYGDPSTDFIGGDIDTANQTAVYDNALDNIEGNQAPNGTATSIGGFAFTWLDNWWQSGAPAEHTIVGTGGFENEWHGVASQGNGARSPILRQLRPLYFDLQDRWLGAARALRAAGGALLFDHPNGTAVFDVPAGAFPAGAQVTLSVPGAFPAGVSATHDMTATGVGFEITEASGLQPGKPVRVYFPYAHANGGFILARFDAARGAWLALPTRRDSPGVLTADIDHFSVFQVMQVSPSPTVDRAVAFPNPARPAQGQNAITFSQLPPGASVKLFTPTGDLVRELNADAAGTAFWDLRNRDGRDAASGVYFALLDGDGGTRTVKVAVQR